LCLDRGGTWSVEEQCNLAKVVGAAQSAHFLLGSIVGSPLEHNGGALFDDIELITSFALIGYYIAIIEFDRR